MPFKETLLTEAKERYITKFKSMIELGIAMLSEC